MIAWLAALAPLAFLAAALVPDRTPFARLAPPWAARLALGVTGVSLAGAVAFGPATTPLLGTAGLGAAVRTDALSAALACLTAFIGLVVITYSRNYLAGDPRQGLFTRQLCLTLALLEGLVLAGNLVQLVVCWILASLCVNRLLLFRQERQAAVLAARKRFIVSRLADAALIAAAVLSWKGARSGDIAAILNAASQGDASWGPAAIFLALAAIFSSAQIPFHGWILEVMETPTPVSALLHAGVVNAGGFLLLRFGPLVLEHPGALTLLTIVGATSAVLGSLVMLTQTSVKVTLAYSTIAQMGFMLLECGLGAYSVALLHLVAHALYKAHAFLSAGDIAANKAPPARAPAAPATLLVAPAVVAAAAGIMTLLGSGPTQRPGAFVLAAVLLLGLLRVALQPPKPAGRLGLILVGAAVFAAHLTAQALFAALLGDLAGVAPDVSREAIGLATGVVALMTGLVGLQWAAPTHSRAAGWARVHAVIANGFYLNTIANRWVLRLWPASPAPTPASGASA